MDPAARTRARRQVRPAPMLRKGDPNMTIVLDGSGLTCEKLVRIARHGEKVQLAPQALERIKAWRAFLTPADRAFFAARMNTEAVRAKIAEADERIEELEAAARSSKPDPGGRSDITGDVAFLERAHRAFTAAHMNTAEVQKWLEEAREKA